MNFCENRAADSVVGYYCALAKREGVPFCAKLDLPQVLPVDEIDLCLVLSNLLENAFEASLRTAPARRKIEITAYVHAERLLLVEVENAFDGAVHEKKRGVPLFQAKGKRDRHPVCPPYCRKDRRGKHVYLFRTAFSQPKLCSADKEPFALAGIFMPGFLQKIHAGRVAAAYRMCYDEVQNLKRSDGF